MWIGIISLFPEMFQAIIKYGVIGKGIKNGLLNIERWNPRDFTYDDYRKVDDRPYGGGPGMVMMVQPLCDAIHAAKKVAGKNVKTIYLSPQGKKLNQKKVLELVSLKKIILVCGRYKGIDERVICAEIDEELSVGDYVLSGGELPAMTLIDSMARFIPGVLGKQSSVYEDSFIEGLLDCAYYTRPQILKGQQVPKSLLSGNHAKISRWRLKNSLGRTWLRRPEFLEALILTKEQEILLNEFQQEYNNLKKFND
ncbi:tRNA (guanosine(37)-N1)-methyltransferase TrmD [Pantoea sp. Aalb]|uniref:tRNA (guanosine(37)-N1)-methyltransferase TrmD n=1 Tax=Pantoea sp. Aalb TaxID=2576762 RepID=UPI001326914D|nr:tRNA (guanosine(37)-N1)-methyltransferase TrmD [Pantoea sp. Aalb]MXP67776.1 tRNA (guanosine(37)-N1)-methyltransferase TrmD [Pantoea sp. Aalb]